jgi:serine O-acetyltransferase
MGEGTKGAGQAMLMAEEEEIGAEETISAQIPDWSRERPRRFWDPSRKPLLTIRRYQCWREKKDIIALCLRKWLAI